MFHSPVELRCDGYEVTLVLVRISQFKNGIKVYIAGVIKGEWLVNDCEERQRFFRPVKRSVFTQKQKAAMKKVSKRLRQKAGLLDPDASFTYYAPYWTSFRALKRHFIKHNSDIELIREQKEVATDEAGQA